MGDGTSRLHGPADPAQFRVKVGGFRFYHDNLPACDIAPATDATWPAVSSIKNAAGRDWSYTTMARIAADLAPNPKKHEGKSEKAIYNDLVALNKTELNRAQDRGTDVHSLLEARAFGGDAMLNVDAEKYRAVVDQFLADCQPVFFLSEVVVINRARGYGGTGDAWCIIDHPDLGRILADWKSRSDSSKHNAYDEECWQVGGAYFHGEYMIVEKDGQAVRQPMPELDGAAIVSLAPESYQVFPIDVERSWETFQRLYDFWASKKDHGYAGKPIYIKRSTPAAADPDEVAKLRKVTEWIKATSPTGLQMLADLWPDGVPTFKAGGPVTVDQCASLALVLETVKREAGVPFEPGPDKPPVEPEPELPPAAIVAVGPDEGDMVTADELDELGDKFRALPSDQNTWIQTMAEQAHAARQSISVNQKPTRRRYEIVRGLVAIALHGEDELLQALVALTVDDDSLTSPALPAGAVVASLGATEAVAFAALCEQYANGTLTGVVGEDGRLRIQAAATV